MASDIVFVRDLRVDVVIGIYDWERRIRQRLYLDIDMATDIRPAAAADDIELTLNYKAVSKRVTEFAEGQPQGDDQTVVLLRRSIVD